MLNGHKAVAKFRHEGFNPPYGRIKGLGFFGTQIVVGRDPYRYGVHEYRRHFLLCEKLQPADKAAPDSEVLRGVGLVVEMHRLGGFLRNGKNIAEQGVMDSGQRRSLKLG